jgi:hypothetical protein
MVLPASWWCSIISDGGTAMGRFAIIENDVVLNVVLAGSAVDCFLTAGQAALPVDGLTCGPGDRYADGVFVPAPVPQPVYRLTKLTIRRRLRALGKEAAFDAALLQMPPDTQADYRDATEIASNDPLFVRDAAALQAAVGLTPEEFAWLTAQGEDV